MPELYLEVCAGLGNRIRSLISGICAAEELGLELMLHWYPFDAACACHFESIFDPDSLPPFVYRAPTMLHGAKECLSVDDWKNIVKGWNGTDDIFIRSYGKFYGGTQEKEARWLHHLRALKPTAFIEKQVNQRLANIEVNQALGVHIRHGDNRKAAEASPFYAFIREMLMDKAPYFVVATDDILYKERLQQHFMERCVFPSQIIDRASEIGMLEAAIDFFALAKCPRILGSDWSSFSHIADLYGGAELTLAKKDN